MNYRGAKITKDKKTVHNMKTLYFEKVVYILARSLSLTILYHAKEKTMLDV